jgi:hypothetical protein
MTPGTTDYTICKQDVTFTNQYFFWGPDIGNVTETHVVLDYLTSLCFKPTGPPTNNPNNPCKNKSGKKITDTGEALEDQLSSGADSDVQNNVSPEFPLGLQCGVNNPACRCTGDGCAGSYIFRLQVTPDNNLHQSFSIKASGSGLGTVDNPLIFSVTPIYQTMVLPDGTTQTGWFGVPDDATAAILSNIPSFGGQWRFDVNGFPANPDSQHRWGLDSWNGTSQLYGTLATKGGSVTSDSFTFWDEPSGCNKTGMDLLSLQGGDKFTGFAHEHQESINTNCP